MPETPNVRGRRCRRRAIVEATLDDATRDALMQLRAAPSSHRDARGRRSAICSASSPFLLPNNAELKDLGEWPHPSLNAADAAPETNELPDLDFDVRGYLPEEMTGLFVNMMAELQLGNALKCTPAAVASFIGDVRAGYTQRRHEWTPEPPFFHDWVHAFDVSQMVFHLLSRTQAGRLLDKESQAALLIAAVLHDMGHAGVTNGFLVATDDELVARFGTQGTLERMHANLALRQLDDEREGGMLSAMTGVASARLMGDVEAAILATDMARHREILDNARTYIEEWHAATEPLAPGPSRRALMALLLKCADISNVARPFELSCHWGLKLQREFHAQGDREKELRLPVSMNCDRDRDTSLSRLVGGFVDFLAGSAFELLAEAIPDSAHVLEAVRENRARFTDDLVVVSSP